MFGREVLLELVDDMVLAISYLLVGCRYLIYFLGSFSYRSKVIVKGIRNITGIGYSITVLSLSLQSTVGALKAIVLREVRDLIPFHVFLTLFQCVSKYLL